MSDISSINSTVSQVPIQLLMAQKAELAGPQPAEIEKIKKLAKDFEGVLLHKVMDEMQKTIPDSGMFSSAATKQMKGMFWMFLSQSVADNGGIGLAKQLTRDFSQMANIADPPAEAEMECLK